MNAPTIAASARKAAAWPAALWIRKIHTWLGALFAPAIVFFAFTGVLQVYGLHRAQPATGHKPPALIQAMGVLHKDQRLKAPRGPAPTPAAAGDSAPAAAPGHHHHPKADADTVTPAPAAPAAVAAPRPEPPQPLGQVLLKAFVAAMAASLILSTLLGVYLGLLSRRERLTVVVLLGLGLLIPGALIVLTR